MNARVYNVYNPLTKPLNDVAEFLTKNNFSSYITAIHHTNFFFQVFHFYFRFTITRCNNYFRIFVEGSETFVKSSLFAVKFKSNYLL